MLSSTYSMPGKIFILGEYAVLAGLPALVATIPIRFRMHVKTLGGQEERSEETSFHIQSPIVRCMQWAKEQGWPELGFCFQDPLQGAGGFGASTAQFGMAYLAYVQRNLKGMIDWNTVWRSYREWLHRESLIPSGADLVCQWKGGIVFFNPQGPSCFNFWPFFDWSQILVFSTTLPLWGHLSENRKIQTHTHLHDLSPSKKKNQLFNEQSAFVQSLKKIFNQGIAALLENRLERFGESLDQYANQLKKADLESSQTFTDRQILRALPGVFGVKGAGALQADAILVCMRSVVSTPLSQRGQSHQWKRIIQDRQRVIEVAKTRGLVLISDGLFFQKGIQVEDMTYT